MQCGKLPNDVLKKIIISNIAKRNRDVIVGPEVGEDCSVVDFGENVCIMTTDPVTAAANNAGRIGVHICCNDIASAGVRPLGVLVTILVPPVCTIDDIKKVMDEVNEACREVGIDVLGGHTEITDAVNRIVLSITAIGKAAKDKFIRTGGARSGDDIVVTGYAGLEGTAIIAKDYFEGLKDKIDEETLIKAQGLLKSISVVDAGVISAEFGVNAMHDATEGGILGAIWEVAEASEKGVYIYEERIPLLNETIEVCRAAGINPLRLISSGSMVIACPDGEGLVRELKAHGIEAAVVGKITDEKRILVSKGKETELLPPESDEIYKVKI